MLTESSNVDSKIILPNLTSGTPTYGLLHVGHVGPVSKILLMAPVRQLSSHRVQVNGLTIRTQVYPIYAQQEKGQTKPSRSFGAKKGRREASILTSKRREKEKEKRENEIRRLQSPHTQHLKFQGKEAGAKKRSLGRGDARPALIA